MSNSKNAERKSKDGRFDYTICETYPNSGVWDVDCWECDGQFGYIHNWTQRFKDYAQALKEFNRFD